MVTGIWKEAVGNYIIYYPSIRFEELTAARTNRKVQFQPSVEEAFPQKMKGAAIRKESWSPGPRRSNCKGEASSPPDMADQAPPPTSGAGELRTELFPKFEELAQAIRRQLSAEAPTESIEPQPDPAAYDTDWEGLLLGLPTSAPVDSDCWPKLYKLAALMTTGRDLQDIQTLLHLVGHWPSLDNPTRAYEPTQPIGCDSSMSQSPKASMQLSTLTSKQGTDEFLDVGPEFWAGFQPSPARTAQRRHLQGPRKSPARRQRGRQQQAP
jgi:hypothetical protein